jgi:hypothetical protein|tara:strand:- start:7113 stop:7418 length:306 start_codon:yes stop_codon:yes gene_type:complete
MVDRPVSPTSPVFLSPPAQYDAAYLAGLATSLNILVGQINNAGLMRGTGLTLTNIPSNDSTLEIGGVFEVNGFLKICKADNPHCAGLGATSSVGTVSVTTG